MYILGVYNGHNATAVLLKSGKVIACASEERFNNIKNFVGFPKKAIDYCLQNAGIASSDLDLITIPTQIMAPIYAARASQENDLVIAVLKFLYKSVFLMRKIWGEFAYRSEVFRLVGNLVYTFLLFTVGIIDINKEKAYLAKYFKVDRRKILCFNHHLSHAAAAYYASPFNKEQALVFTLDGEGDNISGSVNVFSGRKIKVLSKIPRDSSLGYLFEAVTEFLGMKPNEHEYKVMGLAPYAKEKEVEKKLKILRKLIYLDKKNPFIFRSKFNTLHTAKYLEKHFKKVRFDIVAAAFQKLLEEKICEWIKSSIQITKIHTVILGGGVFMNVKVNQKVAETDGVKRIFVMPSCGDESIPLGSAYLGFLKLDGDINNLSAIADLYWGPHYSNSDIEKYLTLHKIRQKFSIIKVKEPEKVIARLLAGGEIVARMNGRMEFGARALGNRSILANPSNMQTVKVINEMIKSRDFWMPFAPSILSERVKDYIKNPKNIFSPFMMMTFDSMPLAQNELMAALHPYDLTLRAQYVTEEVNSTYYRLIKEFECLTGIGGVLNTSFNLHGFPIVKGPQEALFTFENSGLRYLMMENYLISKRSLGAKRF